jgi:arylsulfatase A-like enzyme
MVSVASAVVTAPSRGARPGAAAAVLILLLAGCSSPPPYEAVAVLAEARHAAPLWVLSPDGEVLGTERRPTVEGSRARAVVAEGEPSVVDGVVRQAYRVGPYLSGRRLLMTRSYRSAEGEPLRRLPSVLRVADDHRVALDFTVPDGERGHGLPQLLSTAYIPPPPEQAIVLQAVTVEPGWVLVGGYGLDPASEGASSAAVRLTVVARMPAGEHLLLDTRLEQDDRRSFTWSDYRVELGDLAGETVHLELRSAVERGDGDAMDAVAFPVWSVPAILARRQDDETRNVVLVSLDTLRADFVGAYGQELTTTPSIDRLAGEGVLFENAYTTYPSTTASHMTMLTGLYPSVHGVDAPGKMLSRAHGLLTTALAARGYRTAAVTEDGMLAASAGFARDFAFYREYVSPTDDTTGYVADVVDSAIEWLRSHHDERFFLFLHTYQVHGPYTPPPGYDVFSSYREDGREVVGGPDAPANVRARLGYAGDVLYTDAHLGRLLAELDALGARDDTVVVITADHGEALGEHGAVGHGWYLIEPVLRVPLLIRASGRVPAGLRVTAPASLVDLAPTILELAGVAASRPMQGTSLVPLLADPDALVLRDRPTYAEVIHPDGTVNVVARRDRWKWVSLGDGVAVRYDLVEDPHENAGSRDPAALAPGRELVERYHEENAAMRARLGNARPARTRVDDGTMQKLRALGYVE